jgi:hypothetical protein
LELTVVGHLAKTGLTVLVDGATSAVVETKTVNEVDAERDRGEGAGGEGKSGVGGQGADNGGCSSTSLSASNKRRWSLSSTNGQEEVVLKVSVVRLSESEYLTGFAESRILRS